jgi:phosphatidate cytidylyltransferase
VLRRLATAAVLVPLFLVAVVLGGLWFLAAVMALSAVGAWEYFGMAAARGYRPRAVAGIGLALAFPAALEASTRRPELLPAFLLVAIFGVAMAHLLDPEADGAIASVAVTVTGAAWVGLFFGHLVLLRELPGRTPGMPDWFGALLVAVPILLTWANDTVAYFVGHRWGRRRLLPRVSPGKSVEGAVGALVATVALAFPVLWAVNVWVRLFEPLDALAVGLLIGVAAPCGDLVESAFKRDAGVKDSSRLIPGHGGVLDRFDSLLVTAPVFYYYVHWIVH